MLARFARPALALLALLLLPAVLRAQEEAQEGAEDLDAAIQAKVSAGNLQELSGAIELCDSALNKGLNDEDTEFAKKLLASMLQQRARFVGQAILQAGARDPRYAQLLQFALTDLERSLENDPDQAQ